MKRSSLSGVLVLVAAAAGCSDGTDYGPMGSVSGTLTLDGEPVAEGTMLLFKQMQAGHAAFGETDANGNYAIVWARDGDRNTQIPIGEYHVLIQPPAATSDPEELSAEEMLEGADAELAEPEFPAMYQQHATSGLVFTIDEGENRIDIDLESDAT